MAELTSGAHQSSEASEQAALMRWAAYQSGRYPQLLMLFHIPNGGSRNSREAANLKRQGVKPGVPDLCLPVAAGGYHGLYIELKRAHQGVVSAPQRDWIAALRAQGYRAEVCRGWVAASEVIMDYLRGA